MSHHARRIFTAAALFVAAALLYQIWRQHQPGYGLFDLIKGRPEGAMGASAPKLSESDVPSLARFSAESIKLSAAVLPSVVSIKTDQYNPIEIRDLFGRLVNMRYKLGMSLGSGVIIKGGYVVTNHHVIENAQRIKIITNDGVKHDAEIVGANEEADIAVLRFSGGGDLPALSFANSDEVKVGQLVFAVGNPFGLSGTVTQGIISATQRHLSSSSRSLLQTDTVINPGNSGGPLVNIYGEIVGINLALYAGPSADPGEERKQTWAGVGLTIPANEAKAAAEAIIKNAPAKGSGRGYLGLEFSRSSVKVDLALVSSGVGAMVSKVDPGSPAAKVGFQPGDVVLKFSDMDFRSPEELQTLIQRTKPGMVVSITVYRDGRFSSVVVTTAREP